MKPYKGTAEMHLLANLRLREKLFIAGVLLWAYCVPGCAHAPPEPLASQEPHGVAACLSACTGATYAEVSPKGDLCRCWAPNAFQYTFRYPTSAAATDYAHSRWLEGIGVVSECRAKGWAWEPDETRDHIRCVEPEPDPSPSLLRRTSLGRLRWNDWPRFVPMPAWTQWRTLRARG